MTVQFNELDPQIFYTYTNFICCCFFFQTMAVRRLTGAPRPTHNAHARKSRLPRPIQQKTVSSRVSVK